jgi:nitrate reductase NapAB chaperone NapD
MSKIIDNSELKFLKFNNATTIYKAIDTDTLKSKNEILIDFDLSALTDNKIIALYWKFHNFNCRIAAIDLACDNTKFGLRNATYFSLIIPYQHLAHLPNDDNEENNNLYMYSFAMHCSEIFIRDVFAQINKLSLNIFITDDIKINENSMIELVVQTKVNSNNLPEDLEILEIPDLIAVNMIFENLPYNLKKIKLCKNYDNINLIKKTFPKIPFGCKIGDVFDNEIII